MNQTEYDRLDQKLNFLIAMGFLQTGMPKAKALKNAKTVINSLDGGLLGLNFIDEPQT